MSEFKNQTFNELVQDLINDAFYLEDRSPRGKISTIRQYAEVIVRRILNVSNDEFVTLGSRKILDKIKEETNNNKFLLESLENICKLGNECTHTQSTGIISKDDVKEVIDNLFNLYAYMLIRYFEKYEFGSNMDIVSSFSILPPIIRYITLEYLNREFPENILIIDKLCLATLKAFDKEQAIEWIKARREELEKTNVYTEESKQDLIRQVGEDAAEVMLSNIPNMYNLCQDRINNVAQIIEEKGRLYEDFEGARNLYYEKGIVQGDTEEIVEFNSIMEFLYLGREAKENILLAERYSYFVIEDMCL